MIDPCLDFAKLYDEAYYAGLGADPLVDYMFEMDHPDRTIRRYEWEGIEVCVREALNAAAWHSDNGDTCRWLDFGCGNGGLVRHLRANTDVQAFGFETGWIAKEAVRRDIPMLAADELDSQTGSFDVVTAIEVLEHTQDPIAELRRMRALLRPGGLLFLTTGNAQPHARRPVRWSYVIPEIHISFFEPRTLERAFAATGFRPQRRPVGPGFESVLKFKVLKNVRIRKRSMWTDRLPAFPGLIADRVVRVSQHPVGWAVESAAGKRRFRPAPQVFLPRRIAH